MRGQMPAWVASRMTASPSFTGIWMSNSMICGRSCTIRSIAICPLDADTISSKQDVFARMWFSMLPLIFSSSSAIRSRIFRRSIAPPQTSCRMTAGTRRVIVVPDPGWLSIFSK